MECPNTKIISYMAPGVGNVMISRIQRDQKYKKSPKMGYFLKHYLDIAPILPIHLINVLIGTYIMECPNAKTIIFGLHLSEWRIMAFIK